MGKTQKKRKQERKTSYKRRLDLLKSEIPRIIVRKTDNYVIVQLAISEESKDKIILGISSKELLKHGWSEDLKGSLKSVPASYLTGKLFGKLLKEKTKETKAVLDLGLQANMHGGRVYSVLKGIIDSGFEVPHSEKAFPTDERIKGKHLKENVQKVIEKVNSNI